MNGKEEERRRSSHPNEVVPSIRRMDVSDLLAGDRELILVHRHAEYRLRLTNNDKLILTK